MVHLSAGMVDSFSKRLGLKSGYGNDTVLNPDLKAVLPIVDYDKEKMIVTVSNIGNLGVKELYHILAKYAHRSLFRICYINMKVNIRNILQ